MKEAYTVKKVVLENTTSQQDYPRGYELYASLDGKNWGRVIKKGKGTSDKTVIELDNSVTARYFKIIQTGREETFWWSIDEISLEVE